MQSKLSKIALVIVTADIGQKMRPVLDFLAVVLIVMLLTTIAIKYYESSVISGQVSEAFILTSTVKAGLVVYRAHHGRWPTTKGELNSPSLHDGHDRGKFVDNISLGANGAITSHFGGPDLASLLRGQRLAMRPVTAMNRPGAPVLWKCSMSNVSNERLPGAPRKTGINIVQVPVSCRDY